jgi:hypothetical protein
LLKKRRQVGLLLVFGAKNLSTSRLKSAHENWCRPYGTRAFVPLHPARPCRAFTCRRYAAESALIVLHILSDQVVLRRSLKPCMYG